MNLSNVIVHHAARYPERMALSDRTEEVSYAELVQRIQAAAGALKSSGVGRGDIVAVLAHNSLRFVDVMLACSHIGAVFMPLNWRLAGPELQYIVDHAGARALVSEQELLALASALDGFELVRLQIAGEQQPAWQSFDQLMADADRLEEPAQVAGDDLLRLMYTSGTTSRPKGVMITYDNLYWKCAAHVVELGITHEDIGLACGPLYHVGALDMTLTDVLYAGGGVHVIRRFDAAEALEVIEQRRITLTWMAPAMVSLVLAEPTLGSRDLDSMRLIQDGGEKMPLPLIKRVLESFPNAWFADAYGLTETVSGDTYLDKGKAVDKLGSVGKPVLHTEIAILGADGEALPAGAVGEICIRGPKVFKGYWRQPDATAQAIRDGWFHTEDLGFVDDDGFLFLVDRLKDMIISGGENIASLEVERVLYEHPAIGEVAVVASPDPRWNEVAVAYIVLKDGETVSETALSEFCLERLAKYKAPKAFRFLDELPRNPSGKILKRVLREWEIDRFAAEAESSIR
jgi:fatty-acyl-CoA synthase